MKLLLWLFALAFLQLPVKTAAQTFSIKQKNVPINRVFELIEAQSTFRFIYAKEVLVSAKRVTISVRQATLSKVLQICFADQPLSFQLKDQFIVIHPTQPPGLPAEPGLQELRGKVISDVGEPLAGITVTLKRTGVVSVTDVNGGFYFEYVRPGDILVATGAEISSREMKVDNNIFITITLNTKVGELDQVVMMAYGQTTRRRNTGNISKVTAEEIGRQPVTNPMLALQGRVPGLIINQTNGYGGGALDIQLRGQNSIAQSSQPFIVIDGVPLATQHNVINQLGNASTSGTSPFATLNPADIESIEILKDADATAIYGSRGANGVILITTKKGKAGKTRVGTNFYYGTSKVTRTMNMLNTQQYIQMRKEAFTNDGITPTFSNAADILVWDTTRYTDLTKLFLGGTAHAAEVNINVSGGSATTRFFASVGYHRATTVLPTDKAEQLTSVHTSFNHHSPNKKFSVHYQTTYSYRKSNLPGLEATQYINRAPNMKLYDSAGRLNWEEGGLAFANSGFSEYSNPLAALQTNYTAIHQNINSGIGWDYQLIPALAMKVSLGYNIVLADENKNTPTAALDPFDNAQKLSAAFSNSSSRNWIVEPELEYVKSFRFAKLTILGGSTWQKTASSSSTMYGSNYANDILLNTIRGAGTVVASNSFRESKYIALFGRITLNRKDKYIVNITGRRDGSSRFGPEKQFANFAATGACWIFSDEKFFIPLRRWFSFGKLRASFGSTGNDGIADYKFLDSWTTSSQTYQGVVVILPTGLYNPELAWEINRKTEGAVDLGFFQQRLLFSASYFSNRSGNQLILYNLPIQTGFNTVNRNMPAIIGNSGWEITISSTNIRNNYFSWTTQLNFTDSRNKLVSFPGLEISPYANVFSIGKPLSVRHFYSYQGVNPATGVYTFLDYDNSGTYNAKDRLMLKTLDPSFYGGVSNQIVFKGLQLDILLQFVKQEGQHYLVAMPDFPPGSRNRNFPDQVLKRWQQPGDQATVQRYTTRVGTASTTNFFLSNGVVTDASYIRCKNLSLSYDLPTKWLKRAHVTMGKLYLHAQNLFTLTSYIGADPESQQFLRMPPLRTITAGLQITI